MDKSDPAARPRDEVLQRMPPSEEDDKAAEAEFQRVLGNLAAMPPQPHKKPSPAVPGRGRGRPKKEH